MEKELREALAYNLRVERAKREYTQERLAELAGISSKYLTEIENRKVTPSILIVAKLASALHLSVDKIIHKEDLT